MVVQHSEARCHYCGKRYEPGEGVYGSDRGYLDEMEWRVIAPSNHFYPKKAINPNTKKVYVMEYIQYVTCRPYGNFDGSAKKQVLVYCHTRCRDEAKKSNSEVY